MLFRSQFLKALTQTVAIKFPRLCFSISYQNLLDDLSGLAFQFPQFPMKMFSNACLEVNIVNDWLGIRYFGSGKTFVLDNALYVNDG